VAVSTSGCIKPGKKLLCKKIKEICRVGSEPIIGKLSDMPPVWWVAGACCGMFKIVGWRGTVLNNQLYIY